MTSTSVTPAERKFGTFGGVFTPCTLTILGVIMFLRLGQVVGNAGVLGMLLIVVLSKSITTLTALSLSAIATNTKVRGGGAYYLISRSLGVEFGGAIGVVFYLAQAVSVAMYVIGFTEALLAAFPGLSADPRVVATVVNAVVFGCVYIGASWTIKLQYGILAAVVVSIGAFFVGAVARFDADVLGSNLTADYIQGESFLTMFALFFPAATGIMAGANMSGDLRDPGRSIPRGTLLSVAITAVIYLSMGLLLGATTNRSALQGDNTVVGQVAAWAPLVTLGVFAATASSALGSMMGAPRILQALARDQIFPILRAFGAGGGPHNEPRPAILLTCLIAEIAILAGDLNAIAPIITMFFMITYGSLNLATFYESITKNPSYRPTFRFSHWSTELLAALGCLAAMLLISPLWAVISIVGMVGLHHYISRKEILATWGDVQSGAAFERTRLNLLRLEEERYHPKNWRPSILAFGGASWSRAPLAIYGHWLTGGRGILTLAQILVGSVEENLERRRSQEKVLRKFIQDHELQAFPAVMVASDFPAGIEALVQCTGIGALRPNVVLFGWSTDESRLWHFGAALRATAQLHRSLVILRINREVEDPWVTPLGPIDVWWRGRANGQLMLLFAHLMVQSPEWRGRKIRLVRMISQEGGREEATAHLQDLIHKARIKAEPLVVVSSDFAKALWKVSATSAVVFLGCQAPEEGAEHDFVDFINRSTVGIDNVILVQSSGGMHLDV